MTVTDFGSNLFSFSLSPFNEIKFRNILARELERCSSACAARAQLQDLCAGQIDSEILFKGTSDSFGISIEPIGTDFTGSIGELAQRQPVSRRVFSFESDRV